MAGLIAALLVLGALSDHVGRRPVLAGAIALEVVSLALFLTADNVNILLVARLLQGIATGAAFTTLGAALVDLAPAHAPGRAGLINGIAPVSGLAVGALGCGVLVQFAPAPTHLVWALLLTVGAVLSVTGVQVANAGRTGAGTALAVGGTLLSGIGFGASALASFGTPAAIAAPGELLAVALVISYSAFSIPAVVAGFAATTAGLHRTALVYGLAVAILGAATLVAHRMRPRSA